MLLVSEWLRFVWCLARRGLILYTGSVCRTKRISSTCYRWANESLDTEKFFSQSPNIFFTSCKTCVYELQRQAALSKGRNRLPSGWSRDFCLMIWNEQWFKYDRACMRYIRLRLQAVELSLQKQNPINDLRHEKKGWWRHPSTRWFHWISNFGPWMSLSEL